MGNSASAPEDIGSPSGDGSSREASSSSQLPSEGGSFKIAAISGEEAAGDSSNGSPPKSGSSGDGSSRELPPDDSSLKRSAIGGESAGNSSNGSLPKRNGGDVLSSSDCSFAPQDSSRKRVAINEETAGGSSNGSPPKRPRGSSSSSIHGGSSHSGSKNSSTSRGRQKSTSMPERGKRRSSSNSPAGGSRNSASSLSSSKKKGAPASKRPAAKERAQQGDSVPESGKRMSSSIAPAGGSRTSASSSSKKKGAPKSKKPGAKKRAQHSGFDIIANKIRNGIYRLAGLPDIEKKKPEQIVRACQSAATKTINSNFQESTGKARKRAPTPTVSSSASSRATRSTTSIAPMSTVTETPFADPGPGGDSTFDHIQFSLADRGTDIVEPHKELIPSTQTLTYERLLPENIVTLDVGDELILHVPQSPLPRMEKREKADHKLIMSKLDKVMLSLFGQSLVAFEREQQLKIEKNARTVSFLNEPCLEFSCRIGSYAERFTLSTSNPDESAIDGLWSGGSGFYVEMCGYSPSQSVLIMHRMMPFIKIFKLRRSGAILNEVALKFPEGANPDNMAIPLARKFALVAGDSMKTMEVLMRYYRELNAKAKRALSNQAAKAVKASPDEKGPDELMAELISAELEETKLREFASRVEKLYNDATRKLYSNFSSFKSYLVPRSEIAELYKEMKTQFPTAHALLGILVSSQACPVEVAPLFEQKKKERKRSGDTGIEALLMDSDADSDYEQGMDVSDDEDFELHELESEDISALQDESELADIDQLSAKEHAVLHLFLSALKQKNQKHMVLWSALGPMANWACGHKQNRKKPRTSSACDPRTAWSNLDKIALQCKPMRDNVIRSQKTVTCTFDNCQEIVPKKDQTEGQSAVTLRGTSMFLKRDKTFEVPVGTEMVSPLGIRFKVVTCKRQDPFTVVIKGALLSPIGDDASEGMKDQAIQIDKYKILWPQVGWDIVLMPGTVEHIAPTYDSDQFIPPPVHFRIPKGKSVEDMVLQGCEFAGEGEGNNFTVREYTDGVKLAQRIISLNQFKNHLGGLHTRKLEEKAVWDEMQEEVPADQRKPYVSDYAGIIRDDSKEALFVDTIGGCSKVIGHVYRYQSDCVNQINPMAHKKDQFIAPEVIPREEGSNTGMLLTSLTLHEQCQLLKKAERGEFTLQDCAKLRHVIMNGDALSVRNYRGLVMKITQKLTRFGNEGLVDTLLAALDSVTILIGHFHEDMHRLDCDYRIFYPGCWQAMQFELGVKRVNGDPVKGNFQDHENFALKLFKAFRRYRLRCFLSSQPESELVRKEGETPEQTVSRIEKRLRQYCEEWETGPSPEVEKATLSVQTAPSDAAPFENTYR